MKDKLLKNKTQFSVFCCTLLLLIFFYTVFFFINLDIVHLYDRTVLPGVYFDSYDMSNYSFDEAKEVVKTRSDLFLNKNVTLKFNDNLYEISLKDMGVVTDFDKMIDYVSDYQNELSFDKKIWYINGHNKGVKLPIYYHIDKEAFNNFLNSFKDKVYIKPVDGFFDTSNGVKYIPGNNGYELDVDKSKKIIETYFKNDLSNKNMEITMVSKEIAANTNENYVGIDTMISHFSTPYNAWISQRAHNLDTGVNFINGAIVQPGEVFSFYRYAGPYTRDGYVFYYEYVGNGVCQVATTVYNAALLSGLDIVTRSPHKKKSIYVAGGLDATVASGSDGSWNTDMQFRNTLNYPIYIKAYNYNGYVNVEFWSVNGATEGKTYSTESVWLGGRGYRTYRHTYLDGQEISRDFIATTWYLED